MDELESIGMNKNEKESRGIKWNEQEWIRMNKDEEE